MIFLSYIISQGLQTLGLLSGALLLFEKQCFLFVEPRYQLWLLQGPPLIVFSLARVKAVIGWLGLDLILRRYRLLQEGGFRWWRGCFCLSFTTRKFVLLAQLPLFQLEQP